MDSAKCPMIVSDLDVMDRFLGIQTSTVLLRREWMISSDNHPWDRYNLVGGLEHDFYVSIYRV